MAKKLKRLNSKLTNQGEVPLFRTKKKWHDLTPRAKGFAVTRFMTSLGSFPQDDLTEFFGLIAQRLGLSFLKRYSPEETSRFFLSVLKLTYRKQRLLRTELSKATLPHSPIPFSSEINVRSMMSSLAE